MSIANEHTPSTPYGAQKRSRHMHYDRFDIVSAWCLALSHCHEGQYSRSYARLCHIQTYYRNRIEYEHDLSDNARAIYKEACNRLMDDSPLTLSSLLAYAKTEVTK
jgi:hypothetical protein